MKPCPKTGSGRGFLKTLGAMILGTGAVVILAKNDKKFQKWLEENVPGSDKALLKIGSALKWLESLVDELGTNVKSKLSKPPCDEEGKPYDPKKAVDKRMREIEDDRKREADERRKELEDLEAIELAKQNKSKKKDEPAKKEPPKKTKDLIIKDVFVWVYGVDNIFWIGAPPYTICAFKQADQTILRIRKSFCL